MFIKKHFIFKIVLSIVKVYIYFLVHPIEIGHFKISLACIIFQSLISVIKRHTLESQLLLQNECEPH